jgi:hypothetical protein
MFRRSCGANGEWGFNSERGHKRKPERKYEGDRQFHSLKTGRLLASETRMEFNW